MLRMTTFSLLVRLLAPVAMLPLTSLPVLGQVRVKDITTVEGMRINQLTGMGLITGLNGTGGRSPITRQFALNMVQNFGVRANPLQRLVVPNDTKQRTDNLSVVTVIAELPVNAHRGQRLNVTVAAFDDATSLNGGTLIATPLYGVDDQVYAVAAGVISIGGFSFKGDAGSVRKNHPTTGIISDGATIEREVLYDVEQLGSVRFLLRERDFETAAQIAYAINETIPGIAGIVDAGTVQVMIPAPYRSRTAQFIAAIQAMRVVPDSKARVVVNERTGTVVVGANVRISPVAITHGNLAVVTNEAPEVAQPLPFSQGETAVVPRTQIAVAEQESVVQVLDGMATVHDLAAALNALGVTPRDLTSIFQQLHAAGALHAELITN